MLEKLSSTIVNYSIDVQVGEKVLINYQDDEANEFVINLIKKIHEKKGLAFVKRETNDDIKYYLMKNNIYKDRIKTYSDNFKHEVETYDSFIHIRSGFNDYEGVNDDQEIKKLMGEAVKEYSSIRTNDRKWVLLNFPNRLDAHKAKMPFVDYYNYALEVMCVEYSKLKTDLLPLKKLMESTDKVRLTGVNTDITFSIKGLPAIICSGDRNIPDGEIYTAPVKNSINGTITYNTPSAYEGNVYNNVSLKFKDGKIIEATCNEDNKKLNEIFDKDEGARYVGEFAIGVNPKITMPVGEILYDEKIIGSLHFTPGRCYKDCSNGNDNSMIHWDMVLIQRNDFGGGNIYFDDVLIRENGKFVLDELKHLN